MVFFTCNSCGESLKKAQIDKHKGMCRGCTCLSCIDCGKDFWGEDYKSHVRCITEDQKYGGKGYEAKVQKGDVKQQQWIQRIQEAMNKPGISPKLKDVLNQVSSYDNVPRKKAKFQNWMKNSLRIHDTRLHDQVWEIFSTTDSNQPNGNQQPESKPDPPQPHQLQEQQEEEKPSEKKKNKRERKEERQKKSKKKQAENGNAEQERNGAIILDERQKKEKKKRKREAEKCEEEGQNEGNESTDKPKKRKGEEPEEDQSLEDVEDQQEEQDQSSTKGKFNWKGTIKAVLRQAPDEGLSVKKLRKKVLAAYYSFSGDANYKSEEELFTLFNKKINNPKFKILKDKVRLVK